MPPVHQLLMAVGARLVLYVEWEVNHIHVMIFPKVTVHVFCIHVCRACTHLAIDSRASTTADDSMKYRELRGTVCDASICDVINQNESELTNIDLEIEPNKGNKFFCFLLFQQSFNRS